MVNVESEEVIKIFDSFDRTKFIRVPKDEAVVLIEELKAKLAISSQDKTPRQILEELKNNIVVRKDRVIHDGGLEYADLNLFVDKYKGRMKEIRNCKLPKGFTPFDTRSHLINGTEV